MQLELALITSPFDPFDKTVPSVKCRYPNLDGTMLMAQLRRLYIKEQKETLPWFSSSGKRCISRHDP